MNRRPRYNVVVPTAYGMMIVNRNDVAEGRGGRIGVGWELMQSGHYAQAELDTLALMVRACRPDCVLLDIGANIGVHSLWFSQCVGPGGRVFAFEARRIAFQMLMGNLALNSVENVYARQVAIGAAPGTLHLDPVDYSLPRSFGSMSLRDAHADREPAEGCEAIAVVTLDGLDLPRVDLVKIDVEGMELDVLRGGHGTIERERPLLQVEWLGGDGGGLPWYLVDDLGYRVYQDGINLVCIPAERNDFSIQGAVEITFDGLRSQYGSA